MNTQPDGREELDESSLVSIAKAVSDGQPVDWQGMREENPDAEAMIQALEFLARITEAHRRVLEREPEE